MAAGNVAAAVAYYEQALIISPEYAEVHQAMASILAASDPERAALHAAVVRAILGTQSTE